MPLINGQKMACEPCIRGHRSTKCTHANERLMVPVRKPGRPLSSCPHPSSRPCSCATVTAAIPRKQKCSCGPTAPPTPEIKDEQDDYGSEVTPVSPTKSGNSNYRIRKPTGKNGASRKQSIDAVSLQRMDANQLNILQSYDATQQTPPSTTADIPSSMQGLPLFDSYSMAPASTAFNAQPVLYPVFPQQMDQSINELESPNFVNNKALPAITNGANGSLTNGLSHDAPGANGPVVVPATSGGCCGGKSGAANKPPAAPAPITTNVSSCCSSKAEKKPAAKSCCASDGAADASNSVPPEPMQQLPGMPAQNNSMMISPFPSPVIMPNGMYHYFPPPTVFTYPPPYGSYFQPLQPEQWRQFMSAMSYGQPTPPTGAAVDMRGAVLPPTIFEALETSAGTTHQCTCGDGCQCVGCTSHPYNDATRDYVRSAWNSMMEDAQRPGENGNGHKAYANGNGTVAHNAEANGHASGIDPAFPQNGDGSVSSPAPQTPSDAASNEEQTLSASDFFFVTYPFGDSCAGETASCPCGEDCQCIGCVIHNNPGPPLSTEQEAM